MGEFSAKEALLYDIHGRLLRSYALYDGQRILYIPATLNQGAYVLKVGGRVQKFIVVK